jgi:translation initiation factor 2B subunit (eIF-2B alpha/beta/delta family)
MGAADDHERVRAALDAGLAQVRDDRAHGASWLARLVARALYDGAEARAGETEADCERRLALLHDAAQRFAGARPSMAAVANAAAQVWYAAVGSEAPPATARDVLERLRREARRILEDEEAWAAAIRAALRPLLVGPIFTLSRSGTVERVLIELTGELSAAERETYVCESRPGGEGVATAQALAAAGWRVTLVADAAVGLFMPHARMVLVGADSIRADGSVVNKVGTYPAALAARMAGVPVYAACETLKITAPDFPLHLEEMDPGEILPRPIPGITPRNPYFERTPAALLAGIVTERGLLAAEAIAAIAAEAGRALTALEHLRRPVDSQARRAAPGRRPPPPTGRHSSQRPAAGDSGTSSAAPRQG